MEKIKTDLGYKVMIEDYNSLPLKGKRKFLLDMVIESNLIEGIKYDPIRTISAGEFKLDTEINGHYKALRHVTKNYKLKGIDTDEVKHMHKLLMNDFLNNAGEYRPGGIWVGGKGKPHKKHVNKLMRNLNSRLDKLETLRHVSDSEMHELHNLFEVIHPFSDGNGRTGRLILNWLSLRYAGEFTIIEAKKRDEYFSQIREYESRFRKENPKIGFYKDFTPKTGEQRLLEYLLKHE